MRFRHKLQNVYFYKNKTNQQALDIRTIMKANIKRYIVEKHLRVN